MMHIKISIIVPVYNVSTYLEECLESLLNQTLQEIQIICVEDASTDNSKDILRSYESRSERITAIYHEKNMGTALTRNDGIDKACGEYIMFVDSDDFLERDCCERLYNHIVEKQVDVLQFGTTLLINDNVSQEMAEWVENFLKPCTRDIVDSNLVKECFCNETFDFNLTNKVWKADKCKKAISKMKTGKYIASEDRYAVFILLFYMKSFYGVEDKFYHYRLGVGVTGGEILELDRFEKRCSGADVISGVHEFLENENVLQEYHEELIRFGNLILWDCVDCWHNKLKKEDQKQGYQSLLKYWNAGEILGALGRVYFEEQKDIYDRVNEKKICAIYYRYIGYDVMDKVVSKYIELMKDSYDRMYIITDSDAEESGQVYMGIPLIHVPAATESNWDKYGLRSMELYDVIVEKGISKVFYLSPTSHIRMLDCLLLESMGITYSIGIEEYITDYYENEIIKLSDINQSLQRVKSHYDQIMNSRWYRTGERIKHIFKGER